VIYRRNMEERPLSLAAPRMKPFAQTLLEISPTVLPESYNIIPLADADGPILNPSSGIGGPIQSRRELTAVRLRLCKNTTR
jgi:hypothetical protein